MAGKIEITTRMGCRINCRFCPQKLALSRYYQDDPKRETVMSFEDFKAYLAKIPKDVDILFSGMCEPWLNEACTDMVEYAVNDGRNVDLYTTLVGMHMADYERVRKLKIHIFVLHVADRDGNAVIPVTDEYLEVLDAVAEGHKSGELPITTVSVHGPFHPKIEKIMEKIKDVPVLTEIYDRAGNLKDEEGVTISVEKDKTGPLVCAKCHGDKLDDNYLLPDGSVNVCPMDWGLECILGNLKTDSYEEIQECRQKQEFRRKMGTKNEPVLCRRCHESQSRSAYRFAQLKQSIRKAARKLLKRK
ncbi:MAG: SPASM domain-containing protein [Lachnospiraceae bacterium]|nr:SPASM domain-containing protein [Lachnospiraceae bacterium]